MPQPKGKTGNPAGRPKGTPNKVTGELREVISNVLSKEMTPIKLKSLLLKLEPEKRLNILIKLSDFVLPRLRQTDLNIEFDQMTDSQLDAIIERILNTHQNE